MPSYTHEAITHLPPAALYAALTAINRWPEWDAELEATQHEGAVKTGSRFMLKPKGGPKVAMEVEAAEPENRFADIAHLPLAKMRTEHLFEAIGGKTRMTVNIGISGPLAFLWDRIVARKQAAGAADHAKAFFAFAERYA